MDVLYQKQQQLSEASSSFQLSSYFDNDSSIPANSLSVQVQESSVQSGTEAKMLHLQQLVDNQNMQIVQLKSEVEFHRITATNLQKSAEELKKIKQEANSHADVVNVLVAEKSSLMDALNKTEHAVKTQYEENEELQNRLNASRHRVKHLELELRKLQNQPKDNSDEDLIATAEEIVADKMKEALESAQRLEMEKNELKSLLYEKKTEMEILQKNFDHLSTELHLANVKISQLTDGSPTSDSMEHPQITVLNQEIATKQQQLTEMTAAFDQVNSDKESNECQYQNYISHLTQEMDSLKRNVIELSNENYELSKREEGLLKHIGDLERQIQQQLQKQRAFSEYNIAVDHTDPLQEQILIGQVTLLTEANESLKTRLSQVEAEKLDASVKLIAKIEEINNLEALLEKIHSETPNLPKLLSDFEDKSVAAARAVSQNQSLKDQLNEMQQAFVKFANDKMELTNKLQSEMHLCKEVKTRHDIMERDLQAMKDKWQYKEDEMIRLSHENTELEKKILQQTLEIDRLCHYESKGMHGTEGIIEKELENSKRQIEMLTNKINFLEFERAENRHEYKQKSQVAAHNNELLLHTENNHDDRTSLAKEHLLEEIKMLEMEKCELVKAMNDFKMRKKFNVIKTDETPEINDFKLPTPISVTPSIATEEALEKLQERFKRTMLEVAELTEEKQRLEHLVTQLQFETETIGEYITLYQYQRRMLKQKEHERDIQMKNFATDREKMDEKLGQLNHLIETFILHHTDQAELVRETTKIETEKNKLSNDSEMKMNPNNSIKPQHLLKLKEETAGKILEILYDIKSANRTCDSNIGVEHCSCCLGKLETV